MARDDIDDIEAHVVSSKYRVDVVRELADRDRATPSELARATEVAQPHISRAIKELRDTGVVELLVAESRSVGRYYALTSLGTELWDRVRSDLRTFSWRIAEPEGAPMESLVDAGQRIFGSSLRHVGAFRNGQFTICYLAPEVRASYRDEEIEAWLETIVFDHSVTDLTALGESCWSDVTHFQEFAMLRVLVEDSVRISMTFDTDRTIDVPTVPIAVRDAYREAE